MTQRSVPPERVRIHQPTNAALVLEELRKGMGIGFRRLSAGTGVPITTLANFAYGITKSISADNLVKIAEFYDLSYTELREMMGLEVSDLDVRVRAK